MVVHFPRGWICVNYIIIYVCNILVHVHTVEYLLWYINEKRKVRKSAHIFQTMLLCACVCVYSSALLALLGTYIYWIIKNYIYIYSENHYTYHTRHLTGTHIIHIITDTTLDNFPWLALGLKTIEKNFVFSPSPPPFNVPQETQCQVYISFSFTSPFFIFFSFFF